LLCVGVVSLLRGCVGTSWYGRIRFAGVVLIVGGVGVSGFAGGCGRRAG